MRVVAIVVMFLCVANFGYTQSNEWIDVNEDVLILESRFIDTVIVHHTGDKNIDESVESIDRYHKSIGWDEIGYHYVIRRNGSVEVGRVESKIGAHAKGRNAKSLGIALSGDTATIWQIEALYKLLRVVRGEHDITSIERHHEQCPGPSVNVEDLERAILGSK